jgi:hypothetical protein
MDQLLRLLEEVLAHHVLLVLTLVALLHFARTVQLGFTHLLLENQPAAHAHLVPMRTVMVYLFVKLVDLEPTARHQLRFVSVVHLDSTLPQRGSLFAALVYQAYTQTALDYHFVKLVGLAPTAPHQLRFALVAHLDCTLPQLGSLLAALVHLDIIPIVLGQAVVKVVDLGLTGQCNRLHARVAPLDFIKKLRHKLVVARVVQAGLQTRLDKLLAMSVQVENMPDQMVVPLAACALQDCTRKYLDNQHVWNVRMEHLQSTLARFHVCNVQLGDFLIELKRNAKTVSCALSTALRTNQE